MDEREMFEAYAYQMGRRDFEQNEFGDYRNPFTQEPWNFWRASREAMKAARRTTPDREAVIEECAKVCDSIGFSLNNEWNQRLGVAAELSGVAEDCADAIRALPTIPTSDQGD